MKIIGTFNGATVFALPSDSMPNVTAPSSIEWNPHEVVSTNVSPFDGTTQVYDWQASWWEGTVSFPPMDRWSADAWSSLILACRGPFNTFLIGDPRAVLPKGSAMGAPVVNGAIQTGYTLSTRGWTASQSNALLIGDFVQVGYRLYKITAVANSDSSGHATLNVWPNLRDLPADGTTVITRNCKGLFRLAQTTGNKWSTNPAVYGFTGLQIREAI